MFAVKKCDDSVVSFVNNFVTNTFEIGFRSFLQIDEQTKLSKFEEEIRAEQEEKKLKEAEKKERRQQFLASKAVFT